MRIPRYWIFLSMLFVLGKELETESKNPEWAMVFI